MSLRALPSQALESPGAVAQRLPMIAFVDWGPSVEKLNS